MCPTGVKYLKYTNWKIDRVCKQTNLERFAAHYDFPPETVAGVINDNPHIDQRHLNPAATHGTTILWIRDTWKQSSLYHKMPPRKRLVGDSGYLGKSDKISTNLGGHSDETKEIFVKIQIKG
jgi:hypothetical protein